MNFANMRLLPAAKADLKDIWRYTMRTWSIAQADDYLGVIDKICTMIKDQPQLGKELPELHPALRLYRCRHHLIFYRTDTNPLTFVAFLHERMDMLGHLVARVESH